MKCRVEFETANAAPCSQGGVVSRDLKRGEADVNKTEIASFRLEKAL